MSTALTATNIQKIEELLVTGNLAQFSNQERVAYVNKVCELVGINPLTRPFEFLTFQGKMVMYAKKDCTDQLRKVHGVSIRVTKQEIIDGLLFITVEATDKTGRVDSDIGVISIANLKGDSLANASMKCLTKAKRRVTLSICGLGILDETEVEAMPGAPTIDKDALKADLDLNIEIPKIEAALELNGKTKEGLLNYLSSQFKDESIKTIELNQLTAPQVVYAKRALGVE